MINFLQKKDLNVENVCCVYPTAWNIKKKDLINGYKKIKQNWDFVISATKFDPNPYRSFKKTKKNGLKMIFPKFYNFRTQDLDPIFYDAGQFYWGKSESWLKKKMIFNSKCSAINVSKWKSQDIDTKEDWKKAKLIFKIENGIK